MCEYFVKADPIQYEQRTRTVRIRNVLTSLLPGNRHIAAPIQTDALRAGLQGRRQQMPRMFGKKHNPATAPANRLNDPPR